MDDLATPSATPGAAETEFGREACELLTREMLLTADPDMAIVRIFGSDKAGNAVRVGFSPERALRIGAAFIRAGLAIKPSLRAEMVAETAGEAAAADLRLLTGDGPQS
jgi:hypothetical protein